MGNLKTGDGKLMVLSRFSKTDTTETKKFCVLKPELNRVLDSEKPGDGKCY